MKALSPMGRITAIGAAYGLFMVAVCIAATAQSRSAAPMPQEMMKVRSAITEGSKKMMEGAQKLQEAAKMIQEKKDIAKPNKR